MVQHEFYGEQTVFKRDREQNEFISTEENYAQRDEKQSDAVVPKDTIYRVGNWLPDKTLKLTDWGKFNELCKSNNIELVKLDLDNDLELGLTFQEY